MLTPRRRWGRCLVSLVWLLSVCPVHAAVRDRDVTHVIHVNMHHPLAADDNRGTAELPLKTIHGATRIATANQHNNVGTRIVIAAGIYRETITLDLDPRPTDVAIIFEAQDKGNVIISGADVWTGWERQGPGHLYTRAWPYQWGLSANPWDKEHIAVEPIVRRREMVFVDGIALEQVLPRRPLKDGSFLIAEAQDRISIVLPPGPDIKQRTVEISTRDRLFEAQHAQNIVLRNLTFQQANSPIQESAVRFLDSANITIDHCRFVHNNWIGLGFWNVTNVHVHHTVANHNGGLGMVAWKVAGLLFEENETSYNNWRGAQGGFHGWAVAGIKSLRIHNGMYRRHKAVHNQARGFWLDYDNADIRLEEVLVCQNLLDGVFIEASQGPLTIQQSILCHNEKGAGILSTNSRAVLLEGNTIYGNGSAQIKVDGGRERRVPNWQTGEQMVLKMEGWTLRDNTLVGRQAGQLLVETPNWPHFLRSLTGAGNIWYNPANARAFQVGTDALDFSGWRAVTGQDSGSRFADPRTPGLPPQRSDVCAARVPAHWVHEAEVIPILQACGGR